MENQNVNPFLEPEDYMAQYRKQVEALKDRPEYLEFNRLAFEVFEMNPNGKEFLKIAIERYVVPALANRGTATYQIDVIWGEGFKEFIRFIQQCVIFHKQRISAGK